ncbi:restriction endonuclease [Rhodanobacter sp. C01]|uniref:restriction endonuclease n=1 Tax=Rhodanobacter sp. C01 TaxID=1945856 RepID=UPI0009846BC2|nr:restriction endonuclease [Rhodanobacter sp. C01]OOG46735.1 hypothetical protein B0E50_12125 [Rhodanobacter sp. C01]
MSEPADFGSDNDESLIVYEAHAIEQIASDLIANGEWLQGEVIELRGGIRWRPALVSANGKAIAHLHFASELRSYVVDRITACILTGISVHVVLPAAALHDTEVLEVLAKADATVHIMERGFVAQHHMDAISAARVALTPAARRAIANANWGRMRDGTNHEKGKRFESFLALLLDQTPDLAVVERNYRGDTDEIDLVLQVVRFVDNRCWFQEGVPFLLVEAKNRVEPTSQAMVSQLIRRLQTKRGTARIGLLFTTSKFTQDAELEVIKLAQGQIVVALIGPKEIERWVASNDPHEYLESLVRGAMLR